MTTRNNLGSPSMSISLPVLLGWVKLIIKLTMAVPNVKGTLVLPKQVLAHPDLLNPLVTYMGEVGIRFLPFLFIWPAPTFPR